MSEHSVVGLVIVSHSDLIARGVVQLVAEMSPNVTAVAVGGTADGRLGTDVEAIMHAVVEADSGAGVVVLSDLGSAVLSAETAIDLLGAEWAGRVTAADGPLVEGAVAAGVRAQTGGDLAAVASAGSDRSTRESAGDGSAPNAGYGRTVTLVNPDGLHARPAAEFVKLATSLGAKVTVNGTEARSLLGILSLGLSQGAVLEIATADPSAREAVDRLAALVESGFGTAT